MRDRRRELMTPTTDDYDRAVLCILDDFEALRADTIAECVKAARDGFELAMKNYAMIGPSGMAMQMINSIKVLAADDPL